MLASGKLEIVVFFTHEYDAGLQADAQLEDLKQKLAQAQKELEDSRVDSTKAITDYKVHKQLWNQQPQVLLNPLCY